MKAALKAMHETFDAEYVSLHVGCLVPSTENSLLTIIVKNLMSQVRVSNTAALTLYRDTLGFKQHDLDKQYYADKVRLYLRVGFIQTVASLDDRDKWDSPL